MDPSHESAKEPYTLVSSLVSCPKRQRACSFLFSSDDVKGPNKLLLHVVDTCTAPVKKATILFVAVSFRRLCLTVPQASKHSRSRSLQRAFEIVSQQAVVSVMSV